MAKSRGKNKTTMTADQIRQVLPDYRSTGANLLQARFAACYISNGLNIAQAYRDALGNQSLKSSTASSNGSALLRAPEVRDLLAQYTNNFIQGEKDKLEPKILKTLVARAFWDPKDYFSPEGQPLFSDWSEVPEAARMAIESITLSYFGKNADRSAVEMKMANRHQSLAMLAQYVAMLKGTGPAGTDPGPNGITLTPDTIVTLQSLYSAEALKVAKSVKSKGADSETK